MAALTADGRREELATAMSLRQRSCVYGPWSHWKECPLGIRHSSLALCACVSSPSHQSGSVQEHDFPAIATWCGWWPGR